MTRHMDEICARCQHFKMKEYPDHAKVGLGRCMGYDATMAPLINPFRPWSAPACARYKRPSEMAARDSWIEKRMARERINEGAKK